MTANIERVYLKNVGGSGNWTAVKSVYVGGPMRGFRQFNFPLFNEVTDILGRTKETVFNPAQHDAAIYPNMRTWPGFEAGDVDKCPEFDLKTALRWDLARVLESDALVLLPGWEQSVGATLEKQVADAVGLGVWECEIQAKAGYGQ